MAAFLAAVARRGQSPGRRRSPSGARLRADPAEGVPREPPVGAGQRPEGA